MQSERGICTLIGVNGKQTPNWSVLYVSNQLLELHKDTHTYTMYQALLHYKPFQSWGIGTTVLCTRQLVATFGMGRWTHPFVVKHVGCFRIEGPIDRLRITKRDKPEPSAWSKVETG